MTKRRTVKKSRKFHSSGESDRPSLRPEEVRVVETVPINEYRDNSTKKLSEIAGRLRTLVSAVDGVSNHRRIRMRSDALFLVHAKLQHDLVEILRYAGAMRWRADEQGWR